MWPNPDDALEYFPCWYCERADLPHALVGHTATSDHVWPVFPPFTPADVPHALLGHSITKDHVRPVFPPFTPADVPHALLGHSITKDHVRPVFPPFTPADFRQLAEEFWRHDPDKRWVGHPLWSAI